MIYGQNTASVNIQRWVGASCPQTKKLTPTPNPRQEVVFAGGWGRYRKTQPVSVTANGTTREARIIGIIRLREGFEEHKICLEHKRMIANQTISLMPDSLGD